jgi:glycosyltransferase involved in cell wall biosynthesis
MRVLFVGPVSGYTSYPVVSKGILKAMLEAGIEPVVADVTWDGSPDHTEPCFDSNDQVTFLSQNEVIDLVQGGVVPVDGGDKCVAVNPSHHLMRVKENSIKMAGMFVGDVDVLPDSWKQLMNQQDLVLTPSSWYRSVIQDSGVERPVMVLNHGLSPVFRPQDDNLFDEEVVGEKFVFLHLCSAVFFPERKGTPQVIDAFEQLVEAGQDVILRIIFGMKSKPVRQLLKAIPSEVKSRMQIHFFSGARSQDEIRKSYLGCHAGVFPSRAEGFGMIPLEMRACGVPVIQTFCTGHRDHMDPDDAPFRWGIVEVPHGPMIKAWGKFGLAPEVRATDVRAAMESCLNGYDNLRQASRDMAEAVQAQWSWETTSAPLVKWLLS